MDAERPQRRYAFWHYQQTVCREAWREGGAQRLARVVELAVAVTIATGVWKVTGAWAWAPVIALGTGVAAWLLFFAARCAITSARIYRDQVEKIRILQGGLTDAEAHKRIADRARLLLAAKSAADSWCSITDRQLSGESPQTQVLVDQFARLKTLLEGADWESAARYWGVVSTIQSFLTARNSAEGLLELEKVYQPFRALLYVIDAEERWERSRRNLPMLPPEAPP